MISTTTPAARATRYDVGAIHLALASTSTLDVLGLEVVQRSERRAMVRCPAHDERTPSCSVTIRDGRLLWCCHGCGAAGDVIDLVAVVRGCTRGEAIREAARMAGVEASGDTAPPRPPRRPPALPRRPPLDEVAEVWARAATVYDDPDVRTWLEGRGLDVAKVTDRDLARAIRPCASLPAWARFNRAPWSSSGHRLIVRLWGATGAAESLHARSILADVAPAAKAAAPAGASCAGLVLADGLAVQILTGRVPAWWTPHRIVIAEGEPDTFVWATRWSDTALEAPAVLGVIAGSWSTEIAARVPDGAEVVIRTHADEAGERYATKIAETLRDRCTLLRGVPNE